MSYTHTRARVLRDSIFDGRVLFFSSQVKTIALSQSFISNFMRRFDHVSDKVRSVCTFCETDNKALTSDAVRTQFANADFLFVVEMI